MTRTPLAEKMRYRLLRIKPSPLRFGNERPFIFLHINKTAGTSIGKAIGLQVKQHLTAREIIERIGREKWLSAWKFTFVRNPWDRAVSLYEYRRGKDRTGIATRDLSFSAWTQRVFCEHPDPVLHNNPKSFQTQSEWLRDDRGEINIDFVGRFESITGDFEEIAKKIAPGASLRHLNASARAAYGSYYDSGSKELVTRWFEEDIERFGYVFEP